MIERRSRSSGADQLPVDQLLLDPAPEAVPVLRADEDDREVEDLAGLDQHERLEQLVERPEAALAEHEALGRLHEHRLASVEVLERELSVEVGVRVLFVLELDVEADRQAAGLLAAPVRRLHDPRAAPGDDGEAGLGEAPADLPRTLVRGIALRDPRGSVHGHGRAADGVHGLEALPELVRDRRHVPVEVGLDSLEDRPVSVAACHSRSRRRKAGASAPR